MIKRYILILSMAILWLIPSNCPAEPWHIENKIAVQMRADKLAWYRQNMLEPYKQIGDTNPTWDDYAISAIESMALHWSEAPTRQRDELFTGYESASQAYKMKCLDPLIVYILSYADDEIGCLSKGAITKGYVTAGKGMKKRNYPAGIKIWPIARAALFILKYRQPTNENRKEAAGFLDTAQSLLPQLVADTGFSYRDWHTLYKIIWHARREMGDTSQKIHDDFFNALKKAGAGQSLLHMLQGRYLIDSAAGISITDLRKGRKEIRAKLIMYESAIEELEKAWQEDPSNQEAAALCIPAMLALYRDRSEMEVWFQRAIAADPYYYQAYLYKLQWLNPRYNGSKHEMLVFGRECLRTLNWESQVPLVILDAHYDTSFIYDGKINRTSRHEYYQDQEVWQEIKHLLQVYLGKYPKDHLTRNLYALLACWAQDWETAHKQFQILGDNIQCARFNDDESYRQWRAKAEKFTNDATKPAN